MNLSTVFPNLHSVEFLLELSTLLQSLCIQQMSTRIEHSNPYFFGLYDADWAQIITEMFSRKLNKLCFDNRHYVSYLSNDAVNLLKDVSYNPMGSQKVYSFLLRNCRFWERKCGCTHRAKTIRSTSNIIVTITA